VPERAERSHHLWWCPSGDPNARAAALILAQAAAAAASGDVDVASRLALVREALELVVIPDVRRTMKDDREIGRALVDLARRARREAEEPGARVLAEWLEEVRSRFDDA
jgi:hypothetical protein